jgi:hypothetical protein
MWKHKRAQRIRYRLIADYVGTHDFCPFIVFSVHILLYSTVRYIAPSLFCVYSWCGLCTLSTSVRAYIVRRIGFLHITQLHSRILKGVCSTRLPASIIRITLYLQLAKVIPR